MSELPGKHDGEQCPFCGLPHHPSKRNSCVLMEQRKERDKLCRVPKVTATLHSDVGTLNEVKLSF